MSEIRPTAAILCAEESAERWCCPLCGGLNAAAEPHERPHEAFAALGWCQHDVCVDRRWYAKRLFLGIVTDPEILYPAHVFDGRAPVFA